jgi:hypothetical protein
MFGQDEPSELQREILTVHDRNPDAGAQEIASICDCSASYVRETIDEYRGEFGGMGGML